MKKPYKYDQLSDKHICRNSKCKAPLKMNLIVKKANNKERNGQVPPLWCYKCFIAIKHNH